MRKRIQQVVRVWAWVCAASAFSAACGGVSSTASKREWECSESDACSCQAKGIELGSHSDRSFSGGAVDACSDFTGIGCCLLSQKSAKDPAARCDCFQTVNGCEEEAKFQPGASVVPQCPPPAETDDMCIAEGVACRWGIEGDCCAGTLCLPNAAGVLVCQAASSDDLALGRQCTRVAKNHNLRELQLLTPTLRTSVGELSVPSPMYAYNAVGTNGCLNGLQLTLRASNSFCHLDITVAVQSGKLVVTRLTGSLEECPGFVKAPGGPSYVSLLVDNPAIDLTFQGLACDGHMIFESYCSAGTFDLHISKTTIDSVAFEDQHLILSGAVCSAEPKGECPAQ